MLAFAFSLAGAMLILLRGLVRIVWAKSSLSRIRRNSTEISCGLALNIVGGIAVVFAVLIIVGAYFIYNGIEVTGGVIVLIFSVLSIFVGSGWLIGLILGIIGGICL